MKSGDLRFQEKEHYCFMCFLWQSNELLIFLLLGVSTPLEFWSAVFSQNTAGLFLFFPPFSVFVSPISSSRYLFIHVFLFYAHCPLPPLKLSFGPVQYILACLAPTSAACFPSVFISLPPLFQPQPHHTPYNGALCLAFFLTVVSF